MFHRFKHLAGAMVALLALAACGGGDDPPESAGPNMSAAEPSAQPDAVLIERESAALSLCIPSVTCGFTGGISGLRTAGLVLGNGVQKISVAPEATSFNFAPTSPATTWANVTVLRQPAWQQCTVRTFTFPPFFGLPPVTTLVCNMLAAHVTTLAGSTTPGMVDATGSAARFDTPTGVAVDTAGTLFVTEWRNSLLRRVSSLGAVSTFAGRGYPFEVDGTGTGAGFRNPYGVGIASDGTLYVSSGDSNVRRVTTAAVVTTMASCCYTPIGVAAGPGGSVFAANSHNDSIVRVDALGAVSTYAGLNDPTGAGAGFVDGAAAAARFRHPWGVSTDTAGNVYVADTDNHAIRKISASGFVSTLAGNGTPGFVDDVGAAARFNAPTGVAVDRYGNMYVADMHNSSIRLLTPTGRVITLAGNGTIGSADGIGAAARFNEPQNLTVDASFNIYVADTRNHMIRKITP